MTLKFPKSLNKLNKRTELPLIVSLEFSWFEHILHWLQIWEMKWRWIFVKDPLPDCSERKQMCSSSSDRKIPKRSRRLCVSDINFNLVPRNSFQFNLSTGLKQIFLTKSSYFQPDQLNFSVLNETSVGWIRASSVGKKHNRNHWTINEITS